MLSTKYSLSFVNSIWSEAQSCLPKKILPSATSTTSLPHVRIWQDGDYHTVLIAPFALILHLSFAGCQQYLDRFTWHDSILNFIAKSLQPVINVHSSLYADVNGFLNPLIITGGNYRPDLLFLYPVQVPICSRINSWFRV